MRERFRAWLAPKFEPNVSAARFANCRTVERAYGDLDTAFETDQLTAIIDELTYSVGDERTGRQNPSRIPINGNIRNGLATLKAAVRLYLAFRQGDGEFVPGDTPELDLDVDAPRPIGLERDLQASLRIRIDQLESGLAIIDGDAERSVESGFIDITARDSSGAVVVIELKAGTARHGAISQILSYMGDVSGEEPGTRVRGIIVAADFDHRALAAARMVSNLRLCHYAVNFTFQDAIIAMENP
jgi:hypothetical protein